MRRLYFLGLASGIKGTWRYVFTRGNAGDIQALTKYLAMRYSGEAVATKNGRSALALALKAYFKKGDRILVNGFTCYAVIEAVEAAGCVPVYADIETETLNFSVETLSRMVDGCRGVIIQNTMGNPVDIEAIEKFAQKNKLIIIEDLAHSVGVRYKNGREAGTIGAATVLSFGKDKSVDTVSGGALIYRHPCKGRVKALEAHPHKSEILRARWYPLFGRIARGLTRVRLGGIFMRMLVRIHFVEKSADNRLDIECSIAPYQAKLALPQVKLLEKPQGRIRDYTFVRDRAKLLAELKAAGYYFDAFWYERPVSPERYYKKVDFPEKDCPVAVEAARTIINIPKYCSKQELATAWRIIRRYEITHEAKEGK